MHFQYFEGLRSAHIHVAKSHDIGQSGGVQRFGDFTAPVPNPAASQVDFIAWGDVAQ